MSKIKVVIIDDHAILRMGLTSLLEGKSDIAVVGDAPDGMSGIKKVLKLKPDVVIIDLMMPDLDGIETTKQLLAQSPDCKILILTTFGTSDGISQALNAGAKGAIMKNCDFNELLTAIRSTAQGATYVSPEISRILVRDPPIVALSPRQKEILLSISRGLSNLEIARQLNISRDTVKEYIDVLFQKIGAANRPEAVAIALKKHLISDWS